MFETVFADPAPLEIKVASDSEDAEEELEPEEIIPTFSEEDLEIARKEGFQAGKEEGLNASLDSIERQVSATLGKMETEITRLIDGQKETNDETAHLALSVAVSIARKMLPEMASRNALEEIGLVIENILPRIIDEPRLTVRVHGDVEADVNSRLETLAANAGFEGLVVVNPDNELDIGDCRLEWSCGGAERNAEALWRDIDGIIARNFDKELMTQPEQAIEEVQDEISEAAVPDQAGEILSEPADTIENEGAEDEIMSASLASEDDPDPSSNPDLPPTTDD